MNSAKLVQLQNHLIQLKGKPLDAALSTILKRIMSVLDAVAKGVEHLIARHRAAADMYLSELERGNKPRTLEGLIEDISLNQGKLEIFEEALNSLIEVKHYDHLASQRLKQQKTPNYARGSTRAIRTQTLPDSQELRADFVSNIDWHTRSLQLFDLATRSLKSVDLKEQPLLPFSSHLQVRDNIYVSGGAVPQSNSKSSSILKFTIADGSLARVGDLLQARSSHASIYSHPYLVTVGGNRENHIITKSCERFNVVTLQSEEIACLNHCAAGMALTMHSRFIYKFGGVGEKFESYGMSPYIERYDLEEDCWEVVNPDFSPKLLNRDPFQTLSFCSAFVLNPDTIVVMGGYSQDKQPHSLAYSLVIVGDDEYRIDSIDEQFLPEPGGFWHHSPTLYQGHLFFVVNSSDKLNNSSNIFPSKHLLEFDGQAFSRVL